MAGLILLFFGALLTLGSSLSWMLWGHFVSLQTASALTTGMTMLAFVFRSRAPELFHLGPRQKAATRVAGIGIAGILAFLWIAYGGIIGWARHLNRHVFEKPSVEIFVPGAHPPLGNWRSYVFRDFEMKIPSELILKKRTQEYDVLSDSHGLLMMVSQNTVFDSMFDWYAQQNSPFHIADNALDLALKTIRSRSSLIAIIIKILITRSLDDRFYEVVIGRWRGVACGISDGVSVERSEFFLWQGNHHVNITFLKSPRSALISTILESLSIHKI